MKNLLLVLLMTTSPVLCNALTPKGDAAAPLTVVENGQAKCDISIPANATPQERKAAEDLNHWLEQITGVALRITVKTPAPCISIATDREAAPEQYSIAVDESKNIRLRGGPGRG